MNFKPSSLFKWLSQRRGCPSFALRCWFCWLIFVFMSPLAATSQPSKEAKPRTSFSQADEELLKSVPLIPPPQNEKPDFPFDFVTKSKRIAKTLYKRKYVTQNAAQAQARIKQALAYEKQGDIETFETILIDVIKTHALSPYAAEAALLLGQFEDDIYNLDFAALYYIYIVNVHYHSPQAAPALYRLALLLEKKNNFDKAEELLLLLLKEKSSSAEAPKALEHLSQKYLRLARWYWEKENNFQKANAYFTTLFVMRFAFEKN